MSEETMVARAVREMREDPADPPKHAIAPTERTYAIFRWATGEGDNRRSGEHMFREDPDVQALAVWLADQIITIARLDEIDPAAVPATVEYRRREVWCPGWFSHWTYDTGLSDPEVLASFGWYVERMKRYNQEHGRVVEWSDGNGTYWEEPVQLMGAEDRWRWTARANGTSMIGFGETTGDPPCRCRWCARQGIVRIDH